MLLMGKSTISMGIFNSKLLNYQRVNKSSLNTISRDLDPRCLCVFSPNVRRMVPLFLASNAAAGCT